MEIVVAIYPRLLIGHQYSAYMNLDAEPSLASRGVGPVCSEVANPTPTSLINPDTMHIQIGESFDIFPLNTFYVDKLNKLVNFLFCRKK